MLKNILNRKKSSDWIKMVKLNPDKTVLKKFGMTMAAAFLVISSFLLFRHKHGSASYCAAISSLFLIIGVSLPIVLKPVYLVWMRFAHILGWVNTRVILFILFYLIFTPTGLLMRLFGADLLKRKNKEMTCWRKNDNMDFNPLNYERRF